LLIILMVSTMLMCFLVLYDHTLLFTHGLV
jgi:hypothetical protein